MNSTVEKIELEKNSNGLVALLYESWAVTKSRLCVSIKKSNNLDRYNGKLSSKSLARSLTTS